MPHLEAFIKGLYNDAMWFRRLLVVLAFSSVANAQSLSFGARTELILNFGQRSSFAGFVTGEARGLIGMFGVRAALGFSDAFELAVDGVYRFDGSVYGNLYLGGGLGFSRSGEVRGLIGYEWDIGSNLRVSAEAVTRFPFLGEPRLSLGLGLVWVLPKPAPPPAAPTAPPTPPAKP
jgi:hypothetical protein